MADSEGTGWSFQALLTHIDERFAGSDKVNAILVAELDKRLLSMLAEKSLRDEQRFQAQEQSASAAFRRAEEALLEAKNAAALKFAQSNEWQATFRELSGTYLPRSEFGVEIKRIDVVLVGLSDRIGKGEGSGAGAWRALVILGAVVANLIGVAAVIVALLHR
jgi:hypothetical protein